MASQIPQSPRHPSGATPRGAFWLGVLVGTGIFFGIYTAFSVYLSIRFGGGDVSGSTGGGLTTCDEPQVTLFMADGPNTVERGEAKIWRIAAQRFDWRCGGEDFLYSMACKEDTQYLIVLRDPDSDWVEFECWVPTSHHLGSRLRDG